MISFVCLMGMASIPIIAMSGSEVKEHERIMRRHAIAQATLIAGAVTAGGLIKYFGCDGHCLPLLFLPLVPGIGLTVHSLIKDLHGSKKRY